jgi:hypothetical protein
LLTLAFQVFCKNDAAFLCGDCNTAAHNNPLAARHTIVSAAEAMESAAAASAPDSSSNTTEKPQQQQMPAVPAGKLDKEALTKTVFGKDLEVSSRLGRQQLANRSFDRLRGSSACAESLALV